MLLIFSLLFIKTICRWMIYRIITKEEEQIKDLIEELRLAISSDVAIARTLTEDIVLTISSSEDFWAFSKNNCPRYYPFSL
ncbi:hypothetical protein TorRG33x02_290640 [Trema orientale]|uniref:Uncharacterized protein n=1 Tax=Trema orientale TaxID=63057 RepID=A0A2P5CBZ4_TREOI|nr:hypothetical protein TorRG33x02_290640 [Trema orientale]